MEKLKGNDKKAFHELYFLYYQPLLIFACKFVPEELAKDFVQDCFYNLWRDRGKIKISSSLSAYLFTIIKNRCFKYLNEEKKRKYQQNDLGWKLKKEELTFFTYSEKSILEFDIRDRIENIIDELPVKCREVFVESRFNGLANNEIAFKYDISIKTVEKHISKALKLFREEFKELLAILLAMLIN
jgi:RNA polymerase sigma-70 factor (ECF subfamily)